MGSRILRSKRKGRRERGAEQTRHELGHLPRLTVEELAGAVYLVGNVVLGIPRHLSLRHPCCVLHVESKRAYVVKGTAWNNILPHMRDLYVLVVPDGGNGLTKPTAFEPILRDIPLKALFPKDLLGRLSKEDLEKIKGAIFGNAG